MPTRACRAAVPAALLVFMIGLGSAAHAIASPPAELALPDLDQPEIPDTGQATGEAIRASNQLVRTVENATGVDVPDGAGVAEEPGSSSPSTDPAVITPEPETAPPVLSGALSESSSSDAGGAARTGSSDRGQAGLRARGINDGVRAGDERSSSAPRERTNPSDESGPTGASAILKGFTELPWSLFVAMVSIAVLGLAMTARSGLLSGSTRRLQRQRGELRDDVGALQSALLPDLPEQIGQVGISVAYRPAEGPAAGGDFHDVLELGDGRIGVIVGDVCGHGREALPTTGLVHYTLRAYLEAGLDPRETLRLADEALGRKLRNQFATAVVAVYDPSTSVLEYALAGHPAPIVVGADADHAIAVLTPPPIGVGARTGYRQTQIAIGEGERVWFVSDGLVEARGESGSMIGRDDLTSRLAGPGELPSATEALDSLSAATTTGDDMTACVLSPVGAHGDAAVVEELDINPTFEAEKIQELMVACGMTPGDALRAQKEIDRCDPCVAPVRLRLVRGSTAVRWEVTSLADPGRTPVLDRARRPAAGSARQSPLALV